MGRRTALRILAEADQARRLENDFVRRSDRAIRIAVDVGIEALEAGRRPPVPKIIESIFLDHFFEVSTEALEIAQSGQEEFGLRSLTQLADLPPKLKDLVRTWDSVRKWRRMTIQQRMFYERVKSEYLRRMKEFWRKYGEEWREGDTASKAHARDELERQTKAIANRAKQIIETETTNYYNDARVAYYDEVDDVTHYLFVAIRDPATTAWCKSRDGAVFEKGTELLRRNTPACHWHCRSEVVPLTPLNPYHRRLIEDSSRAASNMDFVPLPVGWRA